MSEHHWTFIGIAYGITVVILGVEWIVLMQARKRAIEAVRRERDFEETPS
ncbi:MAG: heme exporter protein CcmD [Burkholderiaceae bacterium]